MEGMNVALTTYAIAAAISMLTALIIGVSVKVIEFNANRKAKKAK